MLECSIQHSDDRIIINGFPYNDYDLISRNDNDLLVQLKIDYKEIPQSSPFFPSENTVACAKCKHPIATNVKFKQLPTDDWIEKSSMWSCQPHIRYKNYSLLTGKDCLANFVYLKHDLVILQKPANTPLGLYMCPQCTSKLGEALENVLHLQIYRLLINETEIQIVDCMLNAMDYQMENNHIFNFIVDDGQERCFITVLNSNLIVRIDDTHFKAFKCMIGPAPNEIPKNAIEMTFDIAFISCIPWCNRLGLSQSKPTKSIAYLKRCIVHLQ